MGSGLAALVAGGATAFELVDHGVLPGKQLLNEIDGACSVGAPEIAFLTPGPSYSGRFFSKARRRSVGYTIVYPPGHERGDELSVIIVLHGYGDNHETALKGLTPAQAAALLPRRIPMALVTVDGGNGYWTPHPGDDPMAMVIDELIPMCQRLGLGLPSNQIKLLGISMGGFGALAIAERVPKLILGVAAISPAIWTTYDQARGANSSAFASRAAFERYDVISHSSVIRGIPMRISCGVDDPFYPGVSAFVRAVHPETAVFDSGCHTDSFFFSQEPASIYFLSGDVVHG